MPNARTAVGNADADRFHDSRMSVVPMRGSERDESVATGLPQP